MNNTNIIIYKYTMSNQIGTNPNNNNANISANMQSFYVKRVYTDNTFQAKLPTTITLTDFISKIQHKAGEEIFNIEYDEIHRCLNIDVIEAGQLEGELAPALEPSEITMEEKYGDRLKNIAFYVRYNDPV